MSNSSNELLIDQQFDPLARGQFPLLVLGVDTVLSAAQTRL